LQYWLKIFFFLQEENFHIGDEEQAAEARPPLAQTLLSSLAVSTISEAFCSCIADMQDVLN